MVYLYVAYTHKAWSQVGSGGRKPEVLVKVVIGEGNSRDRERKPRPLTLKVPEDWMRKLLEYARPKGRARVRKKGKGCVERMMTKFIRANADVNGHTLIAVGPWLSTLTVSTSPLPP